MFRRDGGQLLVLASVITQITDEEYCAYFTIQSCLINVVVMLAGGRAGSCGVRCLT